MLCPGAIGDVSGLSKPRSQHKGCTTQLEMQAFTLFSRIGPESEQSEVAAAPGAAEVIIMFHCPERVCSCFFLPARFFLPESLTMLLGVCS